MFHVEHYKKQIYEKEADLLLASFYFTFNEVIGINKLDIKVDIDYRLKDKKKKERM